MTGAELGSAEGREEFRRIFEAVIRRFEPRFTRVNVEMLGNAEPLDRTLRFRIDALLQAEPAPEPVVFDSALQPATGNVEVQGSGPMSDELLPYYNRELAFIRRLGGEFAEAHPEDRRPAAAGRPTRPKTRTSSG